MSAFSLDFWREHPHMAVGFMLLVACFGVFANSLQNDFLMDDYPMLIGNRALGQSDFLQTDMKSQSKNTYFRPVTHGLNLITFQFFGPHPLAYHLLNLFLFYAGALSFYFLFFRLFQNHKLAFLTALFYSIHPINGILVNYKNATGFALMPLAMNLSMLKMLGPDKKSLSDILLHVIWFALALLCHEVVIAFPLYLAALLFFGCRYTWKKILMSILPSSLILLTYIIIRFKFTNLYILSGLQETKMSLGAYLFQYTQIVGWYLNKIIIPYPIVLIHEASGNIFDLGMGILFVTVVVLSIFYLWKSYPRRLEFSLALSWIIIGFIPLTLAVLSRPWLGFIIEPHWLVYPSIAYFLILSLWFIRVERKWSKTFVRVLLIALIVFYTVGTWSYNYLWNNQKRYCQYWLKVAPDSRLPNFWLGYTYLEEKDFTHAKYYFEKLRDLGYPSPMLLGNLGYIEYKLKNYKKAESYFKQSLRLKSDVPDTYFYLGDIYLHRKDYGKAEKYFIAAITRDKYLIDSWVKLSELYEMQGQRSKMDKLLAEKLNNSQMDQEYLKMLQQKLK